MPKPGDWGYFEGYSIAVYCDIDPIGISKSNRQGNSTFTGLIIDVAKGVKFPVEYREKIPNSSFWPKKGSQTEFAFFGLAEVIKSTWVQKQIQLQAEINTKKNKKNIPITTAVSTNKMGIGASNNDDSLIESNEEEEDMNQNEEEEDEEEVIDDQYWKDNAQEGMWI